MSLRDQPANPGSEYREFLSPAPLSARFVCLWTQTIIGSRGVYEHRVLPDACVDIVFINDEPATVFGPWTVPFVSRLAAGTTITGARFHPGCAPCLLGMPVSELLNQAVPITSVKGPIQRMRPEMVIEQRGAGARRSALAQALLAMIEYSAPVDQAVWRGIQWLSSHPYGRIGQLSQWLGIGDRQLHRRFSAQTGYSPKVFQSVLRFQRLLKTARETGAAQSLADLALSAGYADQAHMTRDVHRFANIRPALLLRSTKSTPQVSDLFKT